MVKVQFDTRPFSAALREYIRHSERELPEIINQKGFSIAMSASKMTKKADYNKMFFEIGPTAEMMISRNVRFLKKGGYKLGKVNKQKVFVSDTPTSAPRLALIINKWRGERGKPGLQGAEMRAAVEKEWVRRARSIGFLRFGWLQAVHDFGLAIGKELKKRTMDARLKGYKGGNVGGAYPAKKGWVVRAEFYNAAIAKPKPGETIGASQQRAIDFITDGLRGAMNQEMQRMKDHIEQKMQTMTDRVLGRLLR